MYGRSQAGALTQVCVIRFEELLLSTKAELKLRLVRPAQGVSILKGSKGVTSIAVGDKAKIVPGSRTEKEASRLRRRRQLEASSWCLHHLNAKLESINVWRFTFYGVMAT